MELQYKVSERCEDGDGDGDKKIRCGDIFL